MSSLELAVSLPIYSCCRQGRSREAKGLKQISLSLSQAGKYENRGTWTAWISIEERTFLICKENKIT